MKFKASTLELADRALIYRLSCVDGRIQLSLMGMPTVDDIKQSPMRLDSGSNYFFWPLPRDGETATSLMPVVPRSCLSHTNAPYPVHNGGI